MPRSGSRRYRSLALVFLVSGASAQEVQEDQDPIDPDWAPAWDTPFWPAPTGASLELAAGRSGSHAPALLDRLGQVGSGDYVLALLTLPLGARLRPAAPAPGADPESDDVAVAGPPSARSGGPRTEPSAAAEEAAGPSPAPSPPRDPISGSGSPAPSDSVKALPSEQRSQEIPLSLLQDAVDQADKTAGFAGSLSRLTAIRQRARWSGLAPELRLRGATGIDQTRSIDSAGIVPSDQTTRDGSDSLMEIRLTFHLERLLHAGQEVGLERARQDLLADRAAVHTAVGRELVTYVRARWRIHREVLEDEELDRAEFLAEQARLSLYLLTGGWFRGEETLRRYDLPLDASTAAGGRSDAN